MIKVKQEAQDMNHDRKNKLKQASRTIFKPNAGLKIEHSF